MRRVSWILALMIAAPLAACVSADKYAAVDRLAIELRDELDAAKQRVRYLDEALDRLRQELAKADVELTESRAERDQLRVSNEELQRSLRANRDQQSQTIARLTAEKQALEQQLAEARRAQAELEAAMQREVERVRSSYDSLVDSLQSELDAGSVRIEQLQGKLTVSVADRLFFDSGRADVRADGQEVLRKVARVLAELADKHVRIEGHTDNVPIVGNLARIYPTNWELGAARAVNVLRFLQEEAGLDPARLTAVTYGQYHPVADNAEADGRARNRRIEIVLYDPERPRDPLDEPSVEAAESVEEN